MKSMINFKARVVLVLSLCIVTFSCDNDFDQINTDPTKFNTIDESFQFSWVIRRMASERFETWRGNLIYASEWAQHLAGTWGPDQYDVTNEGWSTAQWETTYRDYLRNTNDIIARTEENSNQNLIARVLRVFFMQRLTDLYGDLPYSEAGLNIEIQQPVYDTQQAIYQSFIADLTAASNGIDVSNADDSFIGNEPIYDGDLSKWLRFTNSLLLRVGMRMSEVDPSAAESAVSQALSSGVFESNEDNAVAFFPEANSGGPRNGIGSVFQDFGVTGHQFNYSDEFVTRLQANSDPRIPILMANYDDDGNVVDTDPQDFIGRPNGSLDGFDLEHAQPNRNNMVRYESPRLLFSFAEVEFLRAEAYLRGWASGSPQEAYESGIRAACEHLDIFTETGVTSEEIDALLLEPGIVYNTATGLEQIITQKWLALIFNGYEAYAEYRRTGFPDLTPGLEQGTSDGEIPTKMRYPVLELSTNSANYNDAISRYGSNGIDVHVWWDPE